MADMLYHLHEFRNAALIPAHLWSEAAAALYGSVSAPLLNSTPYGRFLSASAEMVERSTRVFQKPSFGIESYKAGSAIIHVVEKDVMVKPFCTLKYFQRSKKGQPYGEEDPIVLIVAPLSGHHATLLRDTVTAMLQEHNVYITDWANAREVSLKEGDFTLTQYISYMLEFMRSLGSDYHVVAVCQPAVPVAAATALLADAGDPSQPKSMILMGGPIDTRINPGKVNQFVSQHTMGWIKRNLITRVPYHYLGAGREVCPGFLMLTGFMSLNPQRHQDAGVHLYERLILGDEEGATAHRRFYDEYRAVMDLPASYFLESIQVAFKDFLLPRGLMTWEGQKINLASISKTAIFTVEGEHDDISPPGQTQVIHALCPHVPDYAKEHLYQEGVGHYGIFNGRRWRNHIQPAIAKFIATHDRPSRVS